MTRSEDATAAIVMRSSTGGLLSDCCDDGTGQVAGGRVGRLDDEGQAVHARRPGLDVPRGIARPSVLRAVHSSPPARTEPMGSSGRATSPPGRPPGSDPTSDRAGGASGGVRKADDRDEGGEGAGRADDVRMTGRATLTIGRGRVPGSVYRADAPSAKQTRPPTVSRPWLVTVSSRTNEHEAEADQQQAADVERQAAEADEGQDDRRAPQDAGHEVRVLELEEQPVEADREQDEGDVRVGQEVEEPLERVHRPARVTRAPVRSSGDRCWPATVTVLAVGVGEDLVERRGDAVDGAGRDGLARPE